MVAYVSVFNTGRILVQGKDSALKTLLDQMKSAIEAGGTLDTSTLPGEIEKWPLVIRERVPECDETIVRFIEEALRCYKAQALLASAFMLGTASEKAISSLVQTYAESIVDPTNRERFVSMVNNRTISVRFDEFLNSYKSSKSKPTGTPMSQDLETLIGIMFQFCRMTRNEVGHPDIVPEIAKGAVLANIGNFVTYIDRVCGLMSHFRNSGIEV